MIKINNLKKSFGENKAIKGVSCKINDGSVCGLVGSNGSGKSTMLRILAGIYQPTEGEVMIDGEATFDNPAVKERCHFIPDYMYYDNRDTLDSLAAINRVLYTGWDKKKYLELCEMFNVDRKEKLINKSKGIQRLAALIIAFSTCPKYVFMDEVFDGLDPVKRRKIKNLIIEAVADQGATFVIASHELREIDDICDRIIMIHEGNLLAESDLDDLKESMHKIQLAVPENVEEEKCREVFERLGAEIISNSGKYYMLVVHGNIEQVEKELEVLTPVFIEVLNATLEEVFINEVEG